MGHHQETDCDRVHTAQTLSSTKSSRIAGEEQATGEEEHSADVDEPPDNPIKFHKIPVNYSSASDSGFITSKDFIKPKNASLLTQALLSSPDDTSNSEAEAPTLTSDGGLTSPNTPSPHLSASDPLGLPIHDPQGLSLTGNESHTSLPPSADVQPKHEVATLEAGLKQRRCIKFACGGQTTPVTKLDPEQARPPTPKTADPPKRPCMLKFVCPFKPSAEATRGSQSGRHASRSPAPSGPQSTHLESSLVPPKMDPKEHRDSASSVATIQEQTTPIMASEVTNGKPNSTYKRQRLDKMEATRFHEFGGSFGAEDEWTKEELGDSKKMTVNDTLRKEMVIRKLGEEAEEEAIEEDADDDDQEEEEDEDEDEDDNDNGGTRRLMSDDEFSDGNETDDEGGFADSDDESDDNSDYQFWTPGLTTAATSTDHIEHIRPLTHRVASISSIESIDNPREKGRRNSSGKQLTRRRSSTKSLKMRPGTPDLPDSTDFVCGTLDEDRPLEVAYVSCLEERKRSKHRVIPQDIDPSFPTSDPEMDEEDDDEDDYRAPESSDEHKWIAGRLDDSDAAENPINKPNLARRRTKSPPPSPKRLRSPPPHITKRAGLHRSPPPRRLFGHSPPPHAARLRFDHRPKSPPSTRMTSPPASPNQKARGVVAVQLAQRPHLTHTASLPRTPNPFWSKQRNRLEESDHLINRAPGQPVEGHSRGPIDIVKGLENKRLRRREKFWRQHCRNIGKEKEPRRCQPGKGAERMREVGLEMANKCRGYGNNKPQLMLSV